MGKGKQRVSAHSQAGTTLNIVAVLLLPGLAQPCLAAEWSVEPKANIMTEYNDNRTLTSAPHDSIFGYVVDAGMPFAVRTPASEINLIPRVRYQHYDDQALDSDDYYLNVQSRLNSPQTRWQLDAGRSWSSTLTTEMQDVGLVTAKKRRNGWNVNPGMTYSLTERTTFRVSGGYDSVSYEDKADTGLTDSTFSTADATLTYQTTERTSINVTGYYSKFEAVEIGNKTTNVGGQFGTEYRFSEKTRLTASYGYRRTEYEISSYEINNTPVSISDTSDGSIYSIGWQYQAETAKHSLAINQGVLPSGFGYLVESKEARFAYDRPLGERTSTQVNLIAFQHRGLVADISTDDRNYERGEVALRWRMTPFWLLSASYVFSRQQFVDAESTKSNALFLGVNYADRPFSWSR